MSPELANAIRFLTELREGDAVTLTQDGRDLEVHVTRTYRRIFEAGEHGTVSVGFGPGRFNREISAKALVDGCAALRRTPTIPDSALSSTYGQTEPVADISHSG